MKQVLSVVFIIVAHFSGIAQAEDFLKRQYNGFTLWLDCKTHHGAVAFYYEIGTDTGNASRKSGRFRFDRSVPLTCQPQSWRSYRTTTVDPSSGTWDRGHLVPANHMDGSDKTLNDTFFLTNILPQNSAFNQSRGAWHLTEIITECYREITPLKVWGGVIWGNDTNNDYFTVTHGIKTPDFWWKLIYRSDKKEYVAWLFPNHQGAKASDMDSFLISIEGLKSRVDFMPDIGLLKESPSAGITPTASWQVEKSGKMLVCEGRMTSSG
ncbi:MAG: DNA/RNA non-specific endonuclease [Nitrospiria bacterium]